MFDHKRNALIGRDAVRRYNEAEGKEAKDKILLDFILDCAAVAEREGTEFGQARGSAWTSAGGPLSDFVRMARDHRSDPCLGKFLDALAEALLYRPAKQRG